MTDEKPKEIGRRRTTDGADQPAELLRRQGQRPAGAGQLPDLLPRRGQGGGRHAAAATSRSPARAAARLFEATLISRRLSRLQASRGAGPWSGPPRLDDRARSVAPATCRCSWRPRAQRSARAQAGRPRSPALSHRQPDRRGRRGRPVLGQRIAAAAAGNTPEPSPDRTGAVATGARARHRQPVAHRRRPSAQPAAAAGSSSAAGSHRGPGRAVRSGRLASPLRCGGLRRRLLLHLWLRLHRPLRRSRSTRPTARSASGGAPRAAPTSAVARATSKASDAGVCVCRVLGGDKRGVDAVRVWEGADLWVTFSQGSLFTAPPPLAPRAQPPPGPGVVHRASSERASPSARSAATVARSSSPTERKQPATDPLMGNIYSGAINFRPGINAPVDAPQVAAMRARVEAERAGKGVGRPGVVTACRVQTVSLTHCQNPSPPTNIHSTCTLARHGKEVYQEERREGPRLVLAQGAQADPPQGEGLHHLRARRWRWSTC